MACRRHGTFFQVGVILALIVLLAVPAPGAMPPNLVIILTDDQGYAGVDYAHPVISLDIMGTITALAGVEIAAERPLDGVNLVPYLKGERDGAPHDQLFWRKWEQNAMAIRAGDTKLISDGQREKNNYSLFHLADDVGESEDLIRSSPESVQTMLNSWEAWNAQLKDRTFPTLMKDTWWKQ